MKYIKTPKSISIKEIESNNFSLSSSQYKKLRTSDKELIPLKSFLATDLNRTYLGNEVGSKSYIKQSTHYFMRTKALQKHYFTQDFSKESLIPMLPSEFKGKGLKENDIIISKDSNIGEAVIIDKDYPNIMLSSAMYKLPLKDEYREYVLAFIKHDFFREQLDVIVPKGATIRHAKTLFLDCLIPKPKDEVVKKIRLLVQSIKECEKRIKLLFNNMINYIDEELVDEKSNFIFQLPNYNELIETKRLDTGLYNHEYKKLVNKIKEYKNGFLKLEDLDMELSRGQNLQVSNIGKSIYSKKRYDSFYKLILPKYLSKYGTINEVSYLGNEKKLKTLQKGDLIFGAEGFEKGRSIVVIDELEKTITNIHGITIKQKENHELSKGIFVKVMLDYYRHHGIIDMMAVGGNGGSFAQKYWDLILFPNFDEKFKKNLVNFYYNDSIKISFQDGVNEKLISEIIEKGGIYNVDELNSMLKNTLEKILDECIL